MLREGPLSFFGGIRTRFDVVNSPAFRLGQAGYFPVGNAKQTAPYGERDPLPKGYGIRTGLSDLLKPLNAEAGVVAKEEPWEKRKRDAGDGLVGRFPRPSREQFCFLFVGSLALRFHPLTAV